jgi:gamma-glutamyltranspeptidase/glutathione hydrolase
VGAQIRLVVILLRLFVLLPLLALATDAAAATPPARGAHGMVVTEQAAATRVGLDVLRHGGNAIDAAVAVGYALAVVDPCCGNIGGGGFMLIHRAHGGDTFINFREKAPSRATRDMYLDRAGAVIPGASTDGWRAVGVPGTVAGLERARSEYGTRSRQALIAPAIALARDGFVLGPDDVRVLRYGAARFARQPNVAAIFAPGGAIPQPGTRLVQTGLARTLEAIAAGGPDAFYRGAIARRVVAASDAHGGILALTDFRAYTAEELRPVACSYRGYTIVSAPPPSSGGTTLCEILSIVRAAPLARDGFESAAAVHADVEAERYAYADRNTYLGDPDFVHDPVARLLAPAYIASVRAKIGARAGNSRDVRGGLGPPEHQQTTHYSVIDGAGNAVSVTYTINDDFGAGVMAGDTGFLLNDEMDDFTSKPGVPNLYGLVQGARNAIAPGKRPLSSMAPTIALRGGKVAIVAGSPGGSRIITITLGVLQNIIDHGMNVQAAVDAPRFHHQWLPDVIEAERGALTPPVRARLRALGYTIVDRERWGVAEAIVVDPHTGMRYGGSDQRRASGLALGF